MDVREIPTLSGGLASRTIKPSRRFFPGIRQVFGCIFIVNFGEGGWVSTQNVIQLELALKRASRPPDLVLSSMGRVDIAGVDQSGNVSPRELERSSSVGEVGQNKRSQLAISKKETGTIVDRDHYEPGCISDGGSTALVASDLGNLHNLAKMTVENYRANMKVVESLSAEYGFQYISFWSPWIHWEQAFVQSRT